MSNSKNTFEILKKFDESHFRNVDCFIAVPFIDIQEAKLKFPSFINVAAQDLSQFDNGAHTGEISAKALVDHGVKYVIIGHSERRIALNESDDMVNVKTKSALEHGLIPVVCIGEPLEYRLNGSFLEYLKNQFFNSLKNIENVKITVAYEPIWAIGSREAANQSQIKEVAKLIRNCASKLNISIRILYGGSVDSSNAEELKSIMDIDGVLVGGASLSEEFEKVAEKFLK